MAGWLVVCGIEQTNGHLTPDARHLEIRHAQNFSLVAAEDANAANVARAASLASAMNYAQFGPPGADPGFSAGPWRAAPSRAESGNPSAQDYAFIALQNAYRPYGGLMRLHSPAAGGYIRPEGPGSGIEDLVDAGMLFGFPWHHALWIPMFQFDMPGPTVAAGPQCVVAELGRGFDGWALASWFVQPSCWLASHSPIECLGSRLPDVLEAARADRFVATG